MKLHVVNHWKRKQENNDLRHWNSVIQVKIKMSVQYFDALNGLRKLISLTFYIRRYFYLNLHFKSDIKKGTIEMEFKLLMLMFSISIIFFFFCIWNECAFDTTIEALKSIYVCPF